MSLIHGFKTSLIFLLPAWFCMCFCTEYTTELPVQHEVCVCVCVIYLI